MRNIKWLGLSIAAVFLFISGCSGDNAGIQVQPKWTYAVLCDTRGDNNSTTNLAKSGVNEAVVNSVAKDIVKEGAELVIFPGDLVNGWFATTTPYAEQFKTWRKAMAPVYAAGIKVYPVRGNHEDGPTDFYPYPWPPNPSATPATIPDAGLMAAYRAAFSDPWIPANGPASEVGLTYSFVYKNAFFVGLDEFINPLKVNQPWLDEQFKQNKQPHTFVYGHTPAFRVGHPDSLAYYPDDRDLFWNSLGNAGVKMYFSGHDHLYNRAHINDQAGHTIYQVLTGAGGAPSNAWNPPYPEGNKVVGDYHDEVHAGYVLVTVDGPRVTMKWKALLNSGGLDVWTTMDTLEYTVN